MDGDDDSDNQQQNYNSSSRNHNFNHNDDTINSILSDVPEVTTNIVYQPMNDFIWITYTTNPIP
jgi:hypothetical protein